MISGQNKSSDKIETKIHIFKILKKSDKKLEMFLLISDYLP